MPDALLLIAAVALPFIGAIIAGLLPTHARNTAAWLAGATTLVGLALSDRGGGRRRAPHV